MKIISIYYLYHLLFFLLGIALIRQNAVNRPPEGKSRFAVVIPAHNEKRVIQGSLRSILGCDYPGELFDIYVIADNCTDQTADLARETGAMVLERHDQNLCGKQHALKWAFERIDLEDYNGVVVLDSDNHVHPDFLKVLDRELSQGARVVQGYVETQNPCDSWITANYAYLMWYTCRLQMARSKIGLSAWLGGTGLCISTDVLRRVGWNVRTITDDVEYTCQLILAGEKVVFAPDAIVYDQKPVNLADSMRQRLRWIRGQTQVSLKYIPRLLAAVIRFWWQENFGQAARAIDAVMWVPMHLAICASVILSLYQGWWQYLLSVFLTVPVFNMLPMLAEQVKKGKAWGYLVTAGAFFLTWLPITAYGVISCGNKVWWRTPHV